MSKSSENESKTDDCDQKQEIASNLSKEGPLQGSIINNFFKKNPTGGKFLNNACVSHHPPSAAPSKNPSGASAVKKPGFPKFVTRNQLRRDLALKTVDLNHLNSLCENLDALIQNRNRFNPYIQLVKLLNEGKSALAISESFEATIQRCRMCEIAPEVGPIGDPWGFTRHLASVKNQNYTERSHVKESQQIKQDLDIMLRQNPELSKLSDRIIPDMSRVRRGGRNAYTA